MNARATELGILDAPSYRRRLESDPAELARLDALCFVTISRFYRDRRIWDALRLTLLPRIAAAAVDRGARVLRAWSAGCASGEEPFTLAIVWELELAARFPSLALDVLATDFDPAVLARAERGCYEPSSLRELPAALRDAAFDVSVGLHCVRSRFRSAIRFERRDVRSFVPDTPLDLVFCRNVAFTYFDEKVQRDFAARVAGCLVPGGLLVVGGHEAIPEGLGLVRTAESPHVYVRDAPKSGSS